MLDKKSDWRGIVITIIGLFSLIFFNNAQAADQTKKPATLMAGEFSSAQIEEAKITNQNGKEVQISFQASNSSGVQPGVQYSVYLAYKDWKSYSALGEKVYDEILILEKGKSVGRDIVYTVPDYIYGSYDIWLSLSNISGANLASFKLGEISVEASNENYVEILAHSCFLSVKEEKPQRPYWQLAGVDVNQEENLMLTCMYKNHFSEPVKVAPQFKTYRRNVRADLVQETVDQDQVQEIPTETQTPLTFTIPKANIPQAYDTVFTLTSDKKSVSSSEVLHYVVRGKSATILNLTTDKATYVNGETANLLLNWASSADYFLGSRAETGTPIGNGKIKLVIENKNEKICGQEEIDSELKDLLPIVKVKIPIRENCSQPKIKITIADNKGLILDSRVFLIKSPIKTDEKADQSSFQDISWIKAIKWFIIALSTIFILVVILLKLIKNKNGGKGGTFIVILLFSSLAFFLADTQKVSAAISKYFRAYVSENPAISIRFDIGLDKNTYNSGEAMTIFGMDLYEANPTCGNYFPNCDQVVTYWDTYWKDLFALPGWDMSSCVQFSTSLNVKAGNPQQEYDVYANHGSYCLGGLCVLNGGIVYTNAPFQPGDYSADFTGCILADGVPVGCSIQGQENNFVSINYTVKGDVAGYLTYTYIGTPNPYGPGIITGTDQGILQTRSDPNQIIVDLTATRTQGPGNPTTMPVKYEFDCNGDGTFETVYNNVASATQVHRCQAPYSLKDDTKAAVRITQGSGAGSVFVATKDVVIKHTIVGRVSVSPSSCFGTGYSKCTLPNQTVNFTLNKWYGSATGSVHYKFECDKGGSYTEGDFASSAVVSCSYPVPTDGSVGHHIAQATFTQQVTPNDMPISIKQAETFQSTSPTCGNGDFDYGIESCEYAFTTTKKIEDCPGSVSYCTPTCEWKTCPIPVDCWSCDTNDFSCSVGSQPGSCPVGTFSTEGDCQESCVDKSWKEVSN